MSYESSLAALADPTRRAIMEQLRTGPRSVRELADDLPVSRPAVSQHLRVLKESNLVSARRAGNRRIYTVDPRGLRALRRYLDRFWDDVLQAFASAASGRKDSGS